MTCTLLFLQELDLLALFPLWHWAPGLLGQANKFLRVRFLRYLWRDLPITSSYRAASSGGMTVPSAPPSLLSTLRVWFAAAAAVAFAAVCAGVRCGMWSPQ